MSMMISKNVKRGSFRVHVAKFLSGHFQRYFWFRSRRLVEYILEKKLFMGSNFHKMFTSEILVLSK